MSKGEAKQTQFRGITYRSEKACCEHFGVTSPTVRGMMTRNNLSFEDALELVIRRKIERENKGKFIDSEGNVYSTIVELANSAGISISTCRSLLNNETSIDDILTYGDNSARIRKRYVAYGVEYRSLKDICNKFNKSYVKLKELIESGYSVEQAIEYNGNEFTYNGIRYKSFKDFANKHGLRAEVLSYRLRTMSMEEALNYSGYYKPIKTLIGSYRSIKDAAKNSNSTYDQILRYVNHGFDIEICDIIESKSRIKTITLRYIGLDGRAYYHVKWSGRFVTAREIIGHYRPDLLEVYDKYNPTGRYNPYMGETSNE